MSEIVAPKVDTKKCLGMWTDAYHKEEGEEAMISADQIGEWERWCSDGKSPSVPRSQLKRLLPVRLLPQGLAVFFFKTSSPWCSRHSESVAHSAVPAAKRLQL